MRKCILALLLTLPLGLGSARAAEWKPAKGPPLTRWAKDVTPDKTLQSHIVFDRSIFRDCDVKTDSQGTTVTMNTVPLADVSVVPLDGPPRLLLTFMPQNQQASN